MKNYLLLSLFVLSLVNLYCANDAFLMLKGTTFSSETIQDTLLGDLISHVSSSYPLNKNVSRANFPETDLFEQKTNLFIAIDGLGEANLNNLRELLFFTDKTIKLTTPEYPQDSLSTLTNIVTGTDYTKHGIIGHSWSSVLGEVQAYSASGDCQVPKIADLITEARDINVISVSGDYQLAAAVAPHVAKQGSVAFYVSEQGLVNLYTNEVIASKNEIKTSVADLSNYFNFKNVEDYKFVAEIYAVRNLLSLMPTEKNAFVSIALGSLKSLSIKYGASSAKLKNAIKVLDKELFTLHDQLRAQYPTMTTEIVALSSSTFDHTVHTQSLQIKKALADETTTYSLSEVQSYQTSIWTAFWLIVLLITVLYFMFSMEGAENSIIYKTTDGPRPIPDVQ